jgi:hypothetical protein
MQTRYWREGWRTEPAEQAGGARSPLRSSHAEILDLQRTGGNTAVARTLDVGAAGAIQRQPAGGEGRSGGALTIDGLVEDMRVESVSFGQRPGQRPSNGGSLDINVVSPLSRDTQRLHDAHVGARVYEMGLLVVGATRVSLENIAVSSFQLSAGAEKSAFVGLDVEKASVLGGD